MKLLRPFLFAGLLSLPVAANALILSESTTAPTANVLLSQPLFNSTDVYGTQDFSDNSGTPGQTFTVGSSGISLTAITVKGQGTAGGLGDNGGRYWVLSIHSATSTAQGATLIQVAQDASQLFNPNAANSYLTFTLSTPLRLNANGIYEYDIFTTDNGTAPYTSGAGGYYAFAKSANDNYAGGTAMQNGTASRNSVSPGSITGVQPFDRTFYLQGTTVVPEPSSMAFVAAAAGLTMLVIRRRTRLAS